MLAQQGIAACRQLIARTPKSAPAHYYLAMNLGQLARTELLGAFKLVREMEREFKTAVGLDRFLILPVRNGTSACFTSTRPAGPEHRQQTQGKIIWNRRRETCAGLSGKHLEPRRVDLKWDEHDDDAKKN